ncbi:IreB family regulatory phosphoprotein [Weissella kandleri]|uniref:IreB family regulatory phosphoprotein n=1 Tax=Weissella kandleri TaxID=1616 RepID=UPI00387E87BB
MAVNENTTVFKINDSNQLDVRQTLEIVYAALEEKGYNPINQIVGYIISGDPAYIPRNNDARNLIRRYERDEIIEALVKDYLKK